MRTETAGAVQPTVDPGPPDPSTATEAEWRAREIWEFRHDGDTLADLAEREGLTVAEVKRYVAAEERRQRELTAAAPATRPKSSRRGAGSRNPRRPAARV